MPERLKCYLLNSICCWFYRREYRKFVGIRDLQQQQNIKLLEILTKNVDTVYGRKHRFRQIHTIKDYQEMVPLTTYEDYLGDIEKIKNGQKRVLTEEEVLVLEPTGGSTEATKLIPYTKSLLVEFQKGIKPWLYDLYTQNHRLKWGASYWSITPATTVRNITAGGLPVGFLDDREYLGCPASKILPWLVAVPFEIARETEINSFYQKTASALLRCKNLTFISIWNPSFLLLILAYIEKNLAGLLKTLPRRRRGEIARIFAGSPFLSLESAAELESDFRRQVYGRLWPYLEVISCWGDARAASAAVQLQNLFPRVKIQPKGLLATESLVSFPLTGENGARLSLNSHFFEFIAPSDRRLYLAHELEIGKEYEVVVTTSGGFYRYQLRDLIEVTGWQGVFPLIRFKGKSDLVSDLCGEKLHEGFLRRIMERLGFGDCFYLFAPEGNGYVLYLQAAQNPPNLEEALRENFHYDYCRKLGQLRRVKIFKLSGDPSREYLEECVRRGQKLGDIKPAVLHLASGWDKVFKGEYL